MTTFWSLVERRAALTPSAEMLVDERDRRMTFAGFRDRAEALAARLAGHGAAAGVPVTWQGPTVIESLVLTAALARLGAVQNPVMAVYGAADLRFVLRQTGARLLVVVPQPQGRDLAAGVREAAEGREVLVLDGELPETGTCPLPAPEGDDEARWVFYTSGTTSDPKGARHTDRSVLASARGMCERLACTEADRVGMAFPVAHIGGCGTWLGGSLIHGCTLVLDAAFHPERTIGRHRSEGVTLAGSGTVFIQAYLQAQRRTPGERLFPRVRAMTAGAAPKPPTLHAEVKDELGGAGVLSGYGMTEAPILTMGAAGDPDEALALTEGRPTAGVELRIAAADGTVLGPGEEGEIRAKGPQVMRGYVDSALDAEAFDADGYLRTGDLGRLDEAGRLTVTGRLKDVIIRKGETISARRLEEELQRHPGVAEAAVIGLPDPERGEMACAVVVPAGDPPSQADLASFLAERGLPPHQRPERVEFLPRLPRNSMGKILKSELRGRYNG
ncbi:class I adenylate-forming enzyme family protein [Actinocorallia populi]|uniref:class I adenylate-forming enzyme family protein n=1 Tax=Actinocorallia populi TaxID=2079200 RepID=UPI000D0895D8|nr:class I adenylate-forming enzyme family protein [Actinocorallia populi]